MPSSIPQTSALITVDWGSTNLRAFLLDADGKLLDAVESGEGLLNVRHSFSDTLSRHIAGWLEADSSLPVLMCGMVGSRSGWVEVPYLAGPISSHRLATSLFQIESFNNGRCWIVPGVSAPAVSGHVDVMRGEEVQIVGALAVLEAAASPLPDLLCLPGTHSKWVPVSTHSEAVTAGDLFSTVMTGELFSLLAHNSILSQSLDMNAAWDEGAFISGLETSARKGGLLHQLFSVRSRHLNGELDESSGKSYLSGLLIGSEVQAQLDAATPSVSATPRSQRITLIASTELSARYLTAFEYFGIQASAIASESASRVGLAKIARQAGLTSENTHG